MRPGWAHEAHGNENKLGHKTSAKMLQDNECYTHSGQRYSTYDQSRVSACTDFKIYYQLEL